MTEEVPLSIEDRLMVLEILVEDAIWGPHLYNPDHLNAVAKGLYTRLEADERHRTFPPGVRSALLRHADALSGLDNTPGSLRPALRPLVRPLDRGENE